MFLPSSKRSGAGRRFEVRRLGGGGETRAHIPKRKMLEIQKGKTPETVKDRRSGYQVRNWTHCAVGGF